MTRFDDEIYEHLKKDFPEFEPAATINENEMKSKSGKERWRNFMNAYDKRVDDFNFGTMLRTSAKAEYEQETTIFVPRMQFYAIEIARFVRAPSINDPRWQKKRPTRVVLQMLMFARLPCHRNKNGLNDWIYEKAQAEKASK